MSDIDDIDRALSSAKQAVESLSTWVRNVDGRDRVRAYEWEINRGISALEKLRAEIRDGRRHIEPPEDFVRTKCYCSEPNCAPPCGYCESGAGNEEE